MLKDAEGRAAESKLFRAKVTGPLEEFDESLGSPSASEDDPREHSRLPNGRVRKADSRAKGPLEPSPVSEAFNGRQHLHPNLER
jgi:hypothetical protein